MARFRLSAHSTRRLNHHLVLQVGSRLPSGTSPLQGTTGEAARSKRCSSSLAEAWRCDRCGRFQHQPAEYHDPHNWAASACLVLAGIPSWGPSPDLWHWREAIRAALKHVWLKVLTADAGYDSEEAHRFAREEHGIRTIIQNRVGRPTAKRPAGKYRRIMATRFNELHHQATTRVVLARPFILEPDARCQSALPQRHLHS
jgi:hypothetical protein